MMIRELQVATIETDDDGYRLRNYRWSKQPELLETPEWELKR